MRKYGKPIAKDVDYGAFSTDEEAQLIKLLEGYPGKISQAADAYEPAIICSNLIELCSTFNRFYQKHRIITEDDVNVPTNLANSGLAATYAPRAAVGLNSRDQA